MHPVSEISPWDRGGLLCVGMPRADRVAKLDPTTGKVVKEWPPSGKTASYDNAHLLRTAGIWGGSGPGRIGATQSRMLEH